MVDEDFFIEKKSIYKPKGRADFKY